MNKASSQQRRRFDTKAILGLLLPIVAAGALRLTPGDLARLDAIHQNQ